MRSFEQLPRHIPPQTHNLSLKHGNIAVGVLVDDSLVADVLGTAGEL